MSREPQKRKVSYKLYPTSKQALALEALLRSHQQLYNAALEERISAWSKASKSISYADQCKSLTVLRTDLPEWQLANCSSQQMTLRRLDKAFGAFFRRVKAGQTPGFPRFKSLARFPGFSFKSHGDGWRFAEGQNWKHGSLRISGVGQVFCRGKARQGGRVCASDILHRHGEWFLSLTVEIERIDRVRAGDAAIAPALLMQLLSYKVMDTGGDWAIAPTKKLKPSQTCPCCGAVSKKALEERVHVCNVCGHTEPRDTASARVVLNWALYGTPTAPKAISGQELAETGFIPRETPSFASA